METTKIVSNLPLRPSVITSREEASVAKVVSLAGEGLQLQRGRAWRREGLREGRGCAVAKGGAARTSSRRTDFANQQPATTGFPSQAKRFRAEITEGIGGCSLCGVGAQRGGSNQICICQRG
ncbi:hypothetical protein Adt_44210 [Abeliophyllum distichum]|uniref:Uncharacterized protein n=1 Tax=Abeliophyllum distichum TaxID=126358 RepID=A0ABD1PA68_9LAMI